jgi:hypothetical protein
MAVTINGSTGIAGVDGSAGTPAVQGVNTNTGMFFPAADTVGVSTGGTERMRVDSSGNVGIGGAPANGMLELFKTSGEAVLRINNTAGSSWVTFNPSVAAYLHNITNTPMVFTTNGTERARIDTSGNFLFNSGYGSVATAYGCRAWVSFDATASPPTLRGNGNVSSVTKSATGDFIVNFTNAMPDANYAFSGGVTKADTNNDGNMFIQIGGTTTTPPTTTTIRCRTYFSGFTYQNSPYTTVSVFR